MEVRDREKNTTSLTSESIEGICICIGVCGLISRAFSATYAHACTLAHVHTHKHTQTHTHTHTHTTHMHKNIER